MSQTKAIFLFVLFCAAAFGIYRGVENYMISSAKPVDALSSGHVEPKMSTAPYFSMKDLNGKLVEPAHFKDKVLVVNFWASWCAPCVEEFPSILKLIETYKNDVVLVAISGDENEEALRGFIRNYRLEGLPVYVTWDRDLSVASLYGTKKLPESYIFSRGNQFVRKIEGLKNWHSPAFLKTFENLVKN